MKKKINNLMKDKRIKILYTNYFNYTNEAERDMMKNHPKEGHVYRAVWHDKVKSYRVYIAKDNPDADAIAVYIKNLEDKNPWVDYSFTELTEDTLKDIKLDSRELDKVLDWMNENHDDIIPTDDEIIADAGILDEDEGEDYQELSLSMLIDMLNNLKENEKKGIKIEDDTIQDNLSVIKDKEEPFHNSVEKLITYLASTYSDKYEDTPMGNPSLELSYHDSELGVGANMFNAVKYLQRYTTTGFEKSRNVKDLYKAIHYILFELTRRSINKK